MSFAPNFPKHEFEASQTATRRSIDNSIPADLIPQVKKLSWWLQELRNKINRIHRRERYARELPIIITSGYRCPDLNTAIGGSKTSQHMRGQAVDIYVPGMSSRQLVEFIAQHMTGFDQMIEEFGRWTHVSISDEPRGEVLVARKSGKGVSYSPLKPDNK